MPRKRTRIHDEDAIEEHPVLRVTQPIAPVAAVRRRDSSTTHAGRQHQQQRFKALLVPISVFCDNIVDFYVQAWIECFKELFRVADSSQTRSPRLEEVWQDLRKLSPGTGAVAGLSVLTDQDALDWYTRHLKLALPETECQHEANLLRSSMQNPSFADDMLDYHTERYCKLAKGKLHKRPDCAGLKKLFHDIRGGKHSGYKIGFLHPGGRQRCNFDLDQLGLQVRVEQVLDIYWRQHAACRCTCGDRHILTRARTLYRERRMHLPQATT